MICKDCGAELEEGAVLCPACGASQEEPAAEMTAEEASATEVEETAEEAAAGEADDAAEESAEPAAENQPAVKAHAKKNVTVGILVGVIAVLLAVIVAMIVKATAGKKKEVQPEEPAQQTQVQPDEEETAEPAGNGISYTVAADAMTDEVLNKVVASNAGMQLTNHELGVYYWQQYYSFANNYSQYLSYLMDPSLGFDQQMYDEEITWQQFFLENAVKQFTGLAAVCKEAEDAGFKLTDENIRYIADIPASLEAASKSYGYESAENYLHEVFGPGATMEDYQEFVRKNYLAGSYLDSLTRQTEYTKEDISAYFDENSDTYSMYHIQKVDKPNVDIRHILIMPAEDENGEQTEQAWAEAEQKINEIVAEWEAGEKTEDAFAALAAEYSMDGNATSGGIYTDVHPGQMVDEFNDWCFADGRKTGDYGLVKTQYGWHLIFFCAEGEDVYWYNMAESDYLNDQLLKIQDSLIAKYEPVLTLENAAIVDVLQLQKEAAQ